MKDVELPKNIRSATVCSIADLLKHLETGEPAKGTHVVREETPDGPLHTRKEVEITLKEKHLDYPPGAA